MTKCQISSYMYVKKPRVDVSVNTQNFSCSNTQNNESQNDQKIQAKHKLYPYFYDFDIGVNLYQQEETVPVFEQIEEPTAKYGFSYKNQSQHYQIPIPEQQQQQKIISEQSIPRPLSTAYNPGLNFPSNSHTKESIQFVHSSKPFVLY